MYQLGKTWYIHKYININIHLNRETDTHIPILIYTHTHNKLYYPFFMDRCQLKQVFRAITEMSLLLTIYIWKKRETFSSKFIVVSFILLRIIHDIPIYNICIIYIYIYVCIYIIHHEHTWPHTFKNIQKLVNNKQNMQRLVNNIYRSIYRSIIYILYLTAQLWGCQVKLFFLRNIGTVDVSISYALCKWYLC